MASFSTHALFLHDQASTLASAAEANEPGPVIDLRMEHYATPCTSFTMLRPWLQLMHTTHGGGRKPLLRSNNMLRIRVANKIGSGHSIEAGSRHVKC